MKEIYPFLLQSDHEFPFPGLPFKTNAFLLLRPSGNLLVYSTSKIDSLAGFIRERGGIERHYLSHRDEASKFCNRSRELFAAKLFCPALEREEILQKCQVDGSFDGDQQLADDFEVIFTPGHSPGSSCFLWRVDGRRILFTGDNLFPNAANDWSIFLLNDTPKVREQVAASLTKLRAIDVDVLIPAGFEGTLSYEEVSRVRWHEIVEGCLARLA